MAEGFTGGHSETYDAFLLDRNDRQDRRLKLLGGSLSWSKSLDVQGSGTITIITDENADWTVDRVQIWYRAELGQEKIQYPLIVGIVGRPEVDEQAGTTTIQFFDKVALLAEDRIAKTWSFPAGKNVVDAVKEIVESVGSFHNVPDLGQTLRTAMSWPVGTSKLTMVNKLLESIHYVPVRADGQGVLISHYDSATPRVSHNFTPGPECVAGPVESDERDLSDIVNRVIGISTADGDNEPLVSVIDNVDKSSPWSIPRRGRVLAITQDNIDVSDQNALDDYVRDLLYARSQVVWTQVIKHLRVRLDISQAVIAPNGLPFVVEEITQELTPGAMCSTKVRRMDQFVTATGTQ